MVVYTVRIKDRLPEQLDEEYEILHSYFGHLIETGVLELEKYIGDSEKYYNSYKVGDNLNFMIYRKASLNLEGNFFYVTLNLFGKLERDSQKRSRVNKSISLAVYSSSNSLRVKIGAEEILKKFIDQATEHSLKEKLSVD